MTLRVSTNPHPSSFKGHESGIRRVVENYVKYLPLYDIETVAAGETADISVIHAGTKAGADIAHCHGLYWTADYKAHKWEWKANEHVLNSITGARYVTVPSSWVQETFQRDLRFSPMVVGHGVELDNWADLGNNNYVLWNKNRAGLDVCDPYPVTDLAIRNTEQQFCSTFARPNYPSNVKVTGMIPHDKMREFIQHCAVYLSTTKETFGIGTLEAMASGKPILGFANGGNLDLVQHGVNGYLAAPNNFDDLSKGLDFCLANYNTLGKNSRQLAKTFTWPNAVEKIAALYWLATEEEPPLVDIVIPVYNKSLEQLERAVLSAVNQEGEYVGSITVVDDGSSEELGEEYKSMLSQMPEVKYVRKNNGGVATARNHGASLGNSKYILCLDSDDKIKPQFLTACIADLERDRTLGIAYTGLEYIKPDGERGLSPWPDGYDYNAMLTGRNQIPTACVFRREMWKRLGGYKQRYAPEGAGSEDAEFWLRAGAYGWGAKQVTTAGLFVYSWMSGIVSGDPQYREVDWRAWHPWVKDERHPMASQATPELFSHAVRQYDEPTISVVIPVGPGHLETLETALDSLEAQSVRRWEAVVVLDTDEEFTRIESYPYVRLFSTDEPGSGAGVARNIGVANSRAGLILYLDADDLLLPDALAYMLDAYEDTGNAIYSDYYGRAFVEESELADNLRKNIVSREPNGEVVIRYEPMDYDCEKAVAQPSGNKPFLWNNITTLFPRKWHDEIGGFDETMNSWEDIDYWWRMAWAGKCFTRVEEPLMMYKFYAGTRRGIGIKNFAKLLKHISEKKKGLEIMGCGCREDKSSMSAGPERASATMRMEVEMADENMVLVKYMSPNRGQHGVRGMATRTYYGYRSGGAEFLVFKADVAAQPHMFMPITRRVERQTAAVMPETPELVSEEEDKPTFFDLV
jgi:glycosyltransferase involved in cell wall biosynthesis